ncbi:MAG TPA: glycosyltransferase family 2 protein [Steroidobacteraceae bacterium]|nr:glycosyltransferase family 2 protein [Steroidobacteraceae bacterium]
MIPSHTHLVLIPSYNPGARALDAVRAARALWDPVWVIVDGSTDGSTAALTAAAESDAGLRVLVRARNGGKGAAVLDGLLAAQREGFTHALTMDADGQHPADRIGVFMQASAAAPRAMILGDPVFDASAPRIRLCGRKIANWCTNVETLWAGIHDTLFGFRVYPIAPLIAVMQRTRWMRRFDFDPEAVVRLSWAGVPAVNLPAPVRYFARSHGGVSHFNYWRDNVLLTAMYLRLSPGWIVRLPWLLTRRIRGIP